MPGPTNSTKLLMWFSGILVTILIVVVTAVGNQSRNADAAIITQSTAADEKLDKEKLDKEVYKVHIETEKERRVRQDAQWEKIDKKLDKALGL